MKNKKDWRSTFTLKYFWLGVLAMYILCGAAIVGLIFFIKSIIC